MPVDGDDGVARAWRRRPVRSAASGRGGRTARRAGSARCATPLNRRGRCRRRAFPGCGRSPAGAPGRRRATCPAPPGPPRAGRRSRRSSRGARPVAGSGPGRRPSRRRSCRPGNSGRASAARLRRTSVATRRPGVTVTRMRPRSTLTMSSDFSASSGVTLRSAGTTFTSCLSTTTSRAPSPVGTNRSTASRRASVRREVRSKRSRAGRGGSSSRRARSSPSAPEIGARSHAKPPTTARSEP